MLDFLLFVSLSACLLYFISHQLPSVRQSREYRSDLNSRKASASRVVHYCCSLPSDPGSPKNRSTRDVSPDFGVAPMTLRIASLSSCSVRVPDSLMSACNARRRRRKSRVKAYDRQKMTTHVPFVFPPLRVCVCCRLIYSGRHSSLHLTEYFRARAGVTHRRKDLPHQHFFLSPFTSKKRNNSTKENEVTSNKLTHASSLRVYMCIPTTDRSIDRSIYSCGGAHPSLYFPTRRKTRPSQIKPTSKNACLTSSTESAISRAAVCVSSSSIAVRSRERTPASSFTEYIKLRLESAKLFVWINRTQ